MTIEKYQWFVKKLIEYKKAKANAGKSTERIEKKEPLSSGMVNKSFFGFS